MAHDANEHPGRRSAPDLPRLLLVLNERVAGSHDDVRRALDELVATGRLAAYRVYAFPARLEQGLRPSEIAAEILSEAADFLPTGVLWSHTRHLSIDLACVQRLRSLPSRPAMGYWDGDMYQALVQAVPTPGPWACSSLRCRVSAGA